MKILIGVTGSISAYKACDVISGLKANGHEIKVIMTDSAKMFITKMSLAVLSQNEVTDSFFDEEDGIVKHIELSKWADCLLIVPSTANVIAKLANGITDDILTASTLAFTGIKIICPAMNDKMYNNVTTQRNLTTLISDAWNIIDPVKGQMACGDYGIGKLPNPRNIVDKICALNL